MSESLDGIPIQAAVKDDGTLLRWMRAVTVRLLNQQAGGSGVTDFVDVANAQPATIAVPPQVSWVINGIDGQYEITITLPQNIDPASVTQLKALAQNALNTIGAVMVHQVQFATTLNFDAAGGVTSTDPFTQLSLVIQRPNTTFFFRIRSSFDGANWNDWLVYSSAATCGPVGVSSGYLRSTSAANRGIVNNTNTSVVTSTDNGDGTDTIHVDGTGGAGTSFTITDGQGGVQTVPAGTFSPAAQSTFYQVTWSPNTGYQAFRNDTQYPASLSDIFYLITGNFKTCAAGGGGGTTGGGGATGGGGTGGEGGRVPDL